MGRAPALLAALALALAAPLGAAAVCQPPSQRVDVVFDISGSMRQHAGALAGRAAALLEGHLWPGDEVVVWLAGESEPRGRDTSGLTRWLGALRLGEGGGSTNLLPTLEAVWATEAAGPRLTLALTDGADGDERFMAAAGVAGNLSPERAAAGVAALWREAGAGGWPLVLDILPVTGPDGTEYDLSPLYGLVMGDPRLQATPAAAGLPAGWRSAVCLRPERLSFGDISQPGDHYATVRPVASAGAAPRLVPTLVGAPEGLGLEVVEQDGGETLILRLVGRPAPGQAAPGEREFSVRWHAPSLPGLAILPEEQPAAYIYNPPPVVCEVHFGSATTVGWGGPGPLVAGAREFGATCAGALAQPALRLLTVVPDGLVVEAVGAGGEVLARVGRGESTAPLPPAAAHLRLSWERPRRWRGEVAVEVVGPPEASYMVGGVARRSPPAASWAVVLRPPAPWWVWLFIPLAALAAAVALRPRFSSSVSLEGGAGERLRPAREGSHRLPWLAQTCEVREEGGRITAGRRGNLLGVLVARRGGKVALDLRADATVGGLLRPSGRQLALRDQDEVRLGDIVITFTDRHAARRRGQRRRRG